MSHLLGVLFPMALASGVSPMMFSEQLLMLGGPRGRRAALAYLAGTASVLVVLIGVVLTIGGSLSLPTAPQLSAGLDVLIGLTLLLLAVLVRRHQPRHKPTDRQKHPRGGADAYAFGALSMATNLTTLPLVIAETKDIAASGVAVEWMALAVVVLLVGACLPAWVPVLLDLLPGGDRALQRTSAWLTTHGHTLTVVAVGGAGLLFLAKGLLGW